MQTKDIESIFEAQKSLIYDEYYFKYIFKKTEKVVCAVLYVLRDKKDNIHSSQVTETENAAQKVISAAHRSLRAGAEEAHDACMDVQYALLSLESNLRLLSAAGGLRPEHLEVFVAEIEGTTRSLKEYLKKDPVALRDALTSASSTPAVRARPPERDRAPARSASSPSRSGDRTPDTRTQVGAAGGSRAGDRTERIMAVLKSQPGASIKDISEVVTDCSEKTIQRELNDLIKKGRVVREGQKRWSKYTAL